MRRRRFRRSRAEGFGHHPRAGRCGADDDLLPDGEYDRVFSAADGPEIDDECLNRVFPVWDKHSDKIGSVAGPKCPEAKASGHLFSCGTNCVLPLPLSPCRCAGIGVVCCVPCAAADGFRWVLRAVFILFAGVGIHLRPRAVRCSATWYTKKSFCWALAVLEVHLQGIMLTFECHNERNCVCEIKQFGSV